jgi:hypothetical protein
VFGKSIRAMAGSQPICGRGAGPIQQPLAAPKRRARRRDQDSVSARCHLQRCTKARLLAARRRPSVCPQSKSQNVSCLLPCRDETVVFFAQIDRTLNEWSIGRGKRVTVKAVIVL